MPNPSTLARDIVVHLSTGPWTIVTAEVAGMTCHANTLVITPSKDEQDYLDTAIHEALHAAGVEDEKIVARLAGDVAAVLWSLGYRRKKRG